MIEQAECESIYSTAGATHRVASLSSIKRKTMNLHLSRKFLWGIFCLPMLAIAEPVRTVDHVDLTRYQGKWYEIASIPQFFQRKCVRDVSAEYKLNAGTLDIINCCMTEDGKTKTAHGQARIVDTVSLAKLEVTFVQFFGWQYLMGGDYWIIDLASDYRYAVVGHPERKYAWILAKTPRLSAEDLTAIELHLRQNGYDTCLLNTSIQTDGATLKQPLCQAVLPVKPL